MYHPSLLLCHPTQNHPTHIRGVGNDLPQKYFFVGVEGIDYQGHKLGNLCLEGKGLHIFFAMLDFFRHLKDNSSSEYLPHS